MRAKQFQQILRRRFDTSKMHFSPAAVCSKVVVLLLLILNVYVALIVGVLCKFVAYIVVQCFCPF